MIMSLLSLPDELLLDISDLLPFNHGLSHKKRGYKPLVEIHESLKTLCATSKRLRRTLLPALYATVFINLRRVELQAYAAQLKDLLTRMESREALGMIRCECHSVRADGRIRQ